MRHRSDYTRNPKPIHGFTLIELLVVIAIIALLLSIVMPGLNMAKEKTRSIVCRSNLRTLGLASILYADDNEGKLFNYESALWINKLRDHIGKVDEVRYCPSSRLVEKTETALGTATEHWMWNFSTIKPEYGSYAINGWFYSNHSFFGERNYWGEVSNVRQPANTPIFTDARWVDGWPEDSDYIGETYDLSEGDTLEGGHMCRFVTNRHGKTGNIGFLDGHVDILPLDEFWSIKWHPNWQIRGNVRRGPGHNGSPIYQGR